MVSTETLQVIINAKDMLSDKIRQVNNTIRQTGSTASSSSATATSSINRIGSAYDNLRNKVSNVWNTIRNTISGSSVGRSISSSQIAQPFMNAAETIRSKWQNLMQHIQSSRAKPTVDTSGFVSAEAKVDELKRKVQLVNQSSAKPRFDLTEMKTADGQIKVILRDLQNLKNNSVVNMRVGGDGSALNNQVLMMDKIIDRRNKVNSTPVEVKVSNAGLMTLNGEMSRTAQVTSSLNSRFGTLGTKIGMAFTQASAKISAFQAKLSGVGTRMNALVGGLSGVQSAIMGAFGAVGVTSISKFTIGAAVARQKLNAVTTSITGSEAATQRLNKAITSATSGGIVGFTKVAQAVQQIGIKYNLTNAQLEKTPAVLNKIGTLARAMGKDGETAATMMSKAYDGLNGNFMLLKRNLGITEEQLRANGWSGAASDVDGYTNALMKVLDTKPEMQEYLNSFEGQQERLQLAIEGVGRSIGEIVLPVLNAVLGFFLEMHKNAPWLTTAIVGFGIALLGVISVLTILAPILMTIETLGLSLSAILWPLLIVAAVIALIAVLKHLYDTNEGVRKVMDSVAAAIKNNLITAWDRLKKILAPLGSTFNHLMQVLGRLAKDLLAVFGITGDAADNFDWLSAVIWVLGKALEAIITHIVTIIEVVASILVPVISLIVNIISNLVNFIISLAEAFSLLMQGDIVGFFTVVGQALFTLIWDTITNIGQMFLEIFNNLNVVFGGVLTMLWQWLWQFIMGLANGAMQAVNGFIQWISTLPGRLWAWLWNAFLRVVNWASQMVAKFKQAALDAINGFIHWISTLPGKLWDWLMQALAKAKQWAGEHIEQLKDAAKQSLRRFIEEFKIIDAVKDALDGVKRAIENKVGSLVAAMKQLAWDMWNGFWAQFGLGSNRADNVIGQAAYASAMVQRGIEQAYSDVGLEGASFDNTIRSSKSLVYDVNHSSNGTKSILSDIKDLLSVVVDQQETTNNNNGELEATLTQEGTITIQHEINLANVPEGIDEESLIQLIRDLLNSRDVIKELVSNREFQAMDKRVKQKILGEYSRHI
ncbi:hypothetical protein PXD04_10410 [Methanosphaera sp. ISO3-F5]|uniref:phage tail protein n=1 Tax=Methanosphaera sp. ISO3-F5 TaxID=1452353 RepID=UPI002B262FD1|nr:hypothetical protein [Methanosphaera sp. ISO3-F5]WQH64103.1 hypothetical protein PXD04_10410 [Methanosphaera sp. ISO3-F5]